MSIKRRSRYAKSKVYGIKRKERDGVKRSRRYVAPRSLERIDAGTNTGFGSHRTDLPLDVLAMLATGDHQDWWAIADASGVYDIFNLEDGDLLMIPDPSVLRDET